MVLSNAERQARFRQRQKEAAQGVTAEMVVAAAKALYRNMCEYAEEPSDWDAYVASCHKRRGGNDWQEMIPDDTRPDAYDWIIDAAERALIERVALIGHAVKRPPGFVLPNQ